MKKLTFLFVFLFILHACDKKTEKKEQIEENKTTENTTKENDLVNIEKNGKSFYDWYFKNDFPNCDVIKDKNGMSKLDTLSYFTELRKLGTVSEKLIAKERKRLSGCAAFISTLKYSDYENADAYDYDKECPDMYYMYWLKSQETPDGFVTKNVKKINDNSASVDIYETYKQDNFQSALSTVILEKENNIWKIVDIKFINRDESKDITAYTGRWLGGIVSLNIEKNSLAFEYHGQCVYFYPVKKISDTEFEMIWARDMDCKFDNGTSKTFGLKNTPKIGKAFAKYTLKDNVLQVDYYYKDWVKKYTDQVQNDVFVDSYYKANEEEN